MSHGSTGYTVYRLVLTLHHCSPRCIRPTKSGDLGSQRIHSQAVRGTHSAQQGHGCVAVDLAVQIPSQRTVYASQVVDIDEPTHD
jgi:hypothetical protein